MIAIRPLDPAEAGRRRTALIHILQEVVEGGASIGFVLPLQRRELEAYWQGVVASMRDGDRHLLAAFDDGQLIGAVQLALEPRPNGRHRAEIMKLMVRHSHRRRGVARLLMAAVIELAAKAERTLLLLDVRTGDPAEALYHSLGFVRFGEVPRYAREPGGGLPPAASIILSCPPLLRPIERKTPDASKGAEARPPPLVARYHVAALHDVFRRVSRRDGPAGRHLAAPPRGRASVGRRIAEPVARAGATPADAIFGVGEPAALERQAAAADAFGQAALQPLQLGDASVDPRGPRAREA